jgi:ornithine cyclodeaminase
MRVVSAAAVDGALTFPTLIDALGDAFRSDAHVPVRHHHEIERPAPATLLLMPAWTGSAAPGFVGVKVVSVFPGNGAQGLPAVLGTYLLMDGATGAPLAGLDGTRLTVWRTAAASALAARYLARADAERMVMVGAGALAPFLIRAHMSQRPIREVSLWNHRPEKAEALARALSAEGLPVRAVRDLEGAVRTADLVSCATLSATPIVEGAWLKPGAHLDLVGAFNLRMREADDAAVRRAGSSSTRPRPCTRAGTWRLPSRRVRSPRTTSGATSSASAAARSGPGRRGGDHPVQVGRHGARGPRGRDAGVAAVGRDLTRMSMHPPESVTPAGRGGGRDRTPACRNPAPVLTSGHERARHSTVDPQASRRLDRGAVSA